MFNSAEHTNRAYIVSGSRSRQDKIVIRGRDRFLPNISPEDLMYRVRNLSSTDVFSEDDMLFIIDAVSKALIFYETGDLNNSDMFTFFNRISNFIKPISHVEAKIDIEVINAWVRFTADMYRNPSSAFVGCFLVMLCCTANRKVMQDGKKIAPSNINHLLNRAAARIYSDFDKELIFDAVTHLVDLRVSFCIAPRYLDKFAVRREPRVTLTTPVENSRAAEEIKSSPSRSEGHSSSSKRRRVMSVSPSNTLLGASSSSYVETVPVEYAPQAMPQQQEALVDEPLRPQHEVSLSRKRTRPAAINTSIEQAPRQTEPTTEPAAEVAPPLSPEEVRMRQIARSLRQNNPDNIRQAFEEMGVDLAGRQASPNLAGLQRSLADDRGIANIMRRRMPNLFQARINTPKRRVLSEEVYEFIIALFTRMETKSREHYIRIIQRAHADTVSSMLLPFPSHNALFHDFIINGHLDLILHNLSIENLSVFVNELIAPRAIYIDHASLIKVINTLSSRLQSNHDAEESTELVAIIERLFQSGINHHERHHPIVLEALQGAYQEFRESLSDEEAGIILNL